MCALLIWCYLWALPSSLGPPLLFCGLPFRLPGRTAVSFFFRRCVPRDHPSVANLGVPSVGPVIAVSLICSSSQKSDTRARGNGTSGTRFPDNCQLATATRARLCVLFLFCETMTGRQAGESYKLHEVKSYQLLQDRDELWGALR